MRQQELGRRRRNKREMLGEEEEFEYSPHQFSTAKVKRERAFFFSLSLFLVCTRETVNLQ